MVGEQVHIGTSGWSYKHWKGGFYPAGLKPAQWLAYYAEHFRSTEINNSFYRMPTIETVQAWAGAVPEGFTFCPKMSRFLTHMKKLRMPEEPLERFFTVFEPMRAKMGPVLIQLPPFLTFQYEIAEYLYKLLQRRYPEYRFAMEVRHPSWMQEVSLTLMAGYGIAFVISQSGVDFPYSEMITAENIYVRFHGPAQLYASAYSDDLLAGFARKFRQWVSEGHRVWAYFNNDIHGYAPQDADRLAQMLR